MFGTKWPSITSTWIQSAPAASTARTSSPSFEKSDARIDGAMTRGRGTKEADIGAVFRKLFRGKRAFSPNMRKFGRQCRPMIAEKSAVKGTNCRSKDTLLNGEDYHFIDFFTMARRLLTNTGGRDSPIWSLCHVA